MERRPLGGSGIEVGVIGLGCMPMDWGYVGASEDDPSDVIARALELGVNHFDTSDAYGPFTNEETLGRALVGRRDEAVIATKAGLVVGPNGGYPLEKDGRPEHLRDAVDASLRRLRTETIDLYYLHRIDPDVPFEDQWSTLASFVDAGKVRAIGLSEASVDELERASAIHPVSALQSELSVWTRDAIDSGALAWCAGHDVAFVPFSPLGRGYLTGNVTTATFEGLDFRVDNPRFRQEALDENRAIVDIVRGVAERHAATPAQVALAWVLARGEHVLPIPGTKRRRYLQENVGAARLELTAPDLAELDDVPAAVGSRY
jgi:aryl-alcohol dehydrogenase-like predicted oxidoreductase